MQSPTPIAVIINASSGSGYAAEWTADLEDMFSAHGLAVDITLAESGDAMLNAARVAASRAPQVIVAGGGDGTMNAIASALAGSDIALGILPLGTLNHLAKDLQIPQQLDDAVRNIATGRRARIDLGKVNDRIFLNNSSIGIYPDVVRERDRQQRRLGWGKWPAFCWAVLMALRRYPFLDLKLKLHDKTHNRSTPFIFVGNNEYAMEGFDIGSRSRLDNGQLGLYVARRIGRLGLLKLALRALFRRLSQARDFDISVVEEVEIDARKKRLRVATDGEVTLMNTPLHYRILPKALTVIVPQDSPTGKAPA